MNYACQVYNHEKKIMDLVGGFKPSEKYESQLELFSQYMENIKMFQTINQCINV